MSKVVLLGVNLERKLNLESPTPHFKLQLSKEYLWSFYEVFQIKTVAKKYIKLLLLPESVVIFRRW